MNIHVQVFISLGYIRRSGIAESYSRNHCQDQCYELFHLVFSFRNFRVLDPMFKSLIHFELTFCVQYEGPISFFLHADIQFSQNHLLNRLSFPHCVFLVPLLKISHLSMCVFISGLYFLPLVCMSVFMLIQLLFNYCSFVLCFEIRKCEASSFVL